MNMRFILISFISCFFAQLVHAQNFLILNNGSKVEYKKFRMDTQQGTIEIKKPDKHIIKISDVNYLLNFGEIKYLKQESNQSRYILMDREVEGKINVYSSLVVTQGSYVTSSTQYYFLEKGEEFDFILNTAVLAP